MFKAPKQQGFRFVVSALHPCGEEEIFQTNLKKLANEVFNNWLKNPLLTCESITDLKPK